MFIILIILLLLISYTPFESFIYISIALDLFHMALPSPPDPRPDPAFFRYI